MKRRRLPLVLALWVVLLLSPLAASGQDPADTDPKPIKVIVLAGGKWVYVEMIEERHGSIIYQKPGGRPIAAKEHSLDKKATREVNQAFANLFDACAGEERDLATMFELKGRSRNLFLSIASRQSKDCLQRLYHQYQVDLKADKKPASDGQLSKLARTRKISTAQGDSVVISDQNLRKSSEKKAYAPGTAYGRCLDAHIPNLVQAFNAIKRPEDSDFDRGSWASATVAECDRLVSEANKVKGCVPDSRYAAAHSKVIVAMDAFRRAGTDIKSGISRNGELGFETGYQAKLDGLDPLGDAWRALSDAEASNTVASNMTIGNEEFFAGDVPATVKSYCQEKWDDDYEMRAYCQKEQFEAIEALKRTNPYSLGLEVKEFQAIRSKCKTKWHPDYEMREYCENRQIEAYQDLIE